MGASFNGKAYKEIYKHEKWKETAEKYEETFAVNLYKTDYVQEAARTALTKLSRMLNVYYRNKGQRVLENQLRWGDWKPAEKDIEITDTLMEALLPEKNNTGVAGQIRNEGLYLQEKYLNGMKAAGREYNPNTLEEEKEAGRKEDWINLNRIVNSEHDGSEFRKQYDHIINNGYSNLRETMAMLSNGMFRNGGQDASQIAGGRSLKNMMAYITREEIEANPEFKDIPLELLEEMGQRSSRGDVFDTFSLARDLKRASDKLGDRGNAVTRFFSGLYRGFVAAISNKFARRTRSAEERRKNGLDLEYVAPHREAYISKKEMENMREGELPYVIILRGGGSEVKESKDGFTFGVRPRYPDVQGLSISTAEQKAAFTRKEEEKREDGSEYKSVRQWWEGGKALYEMKKPVTAGGMLQMAGFSENALKMLGAYKLMGADLRELLYFRLALIAWMVTSQDHSLYEIMKASQSAGVVGKEDLSEPAAMYMSVDPIPVDVLRQKFAPEHRFPHETVYGIMLNELREKRQKKAGQSGKAFTLFGAGAGRDLDATQTDTQELAFNIYTSNASLAMEQGQKKGNRAAKRALFTREGDQGGYEGWGADEVMDSEIKEDIFNLVRISSRMVQDGLEERGQKQEGDTLLEELDSQGERTIERRPGKNAFTGTLYRGGSLNRELMSGEGSEITLSFIESGSSKFSIGMNDYNSVRDRDGEDKAVLIEYRMTGKGAVDISGFSSRQGEGKVLIPANTKFKVVTPLRKVLITSRGIQWNDSAVTKTPEGESQYYGYVISLEEVEGPGSAKRNEQGKVPEIRKEIRNYYLNPHKRMQKKGILQIM